MTGSAEVNPSYRVLSFRWEKSHSCKEKGIPKSECVSFLPLTLTYLAPTHEQLHLLSCEEICQATVPHDQIKTLLECIKLLCNAFVQQPVHVQINILLLSKGQI